jgi:signal transduction histidine kinase/putative methionine-R-sulfoxide reductase with GAF domain
VRIRALEGELAHERRTLRALREIGLALSTPADFEQTLELILAKIAEILEADRATLYFLDDSGNELFSRIMVGGALQSIRVKVGSGIAGRVAETGKPIRVKDAYRDKRFLRDWDKLTGFRTRSILAAPMRNHRGSIIGVVQALNKSGDGGFTREDETLLIGLATQAAVTVDNSRLFIEVTEANRQLFHTAEQLKHRVRDLDLLLKLESAMGRAGTTDDLVRAALSETIQATDAKGGGILLPDDVTGQLTLHFLEAERSRSIRRLTLRHGEGFIGAVMARGTAGDLTSVDHDRDAASRIDRVMGFGVDSALAVPLEGQDGAVFGAMALYNKKAYPFVFSEEDSKLLKLIAANVSTAAQLHQSRIAQERTERLTTIGRLLSSVIHDLKTPMTVISGYVQLMVSSNDPKQRADYSDLVLRQFDLVQQMQREVLEFARGEKSVLIRRVYLQNFMKGLEQSLLPEVEAHGIKLKLELEDKGVARLDEGKIIRAIQNLVRNALEAMGDNPGTLTLGVRREGTTVVFFVSDTGPGIPKEIEGRLFESFVTAGKKEGTGLGLAIVKKIVDEHSGSIELQTSPQGTTFRLLLPQS